MNRDNYFFGLLTGIAAPLFGVLFLYVIRWMPRGLEFSEFMFELKSNKSFASSTLSLALITCIFLFTFFKNRKLYKSLYGTFIAVGLFAILIVGWKTNLF